MLLLERLDNAMEAGDVTEYEECMEALKISKTDMIDKAFNYGKAIRMKEAEIEYYKKMEKEAKAAKKRCEKSVDHMKDALLYAMQQIGLKEINISPGKKVVIRESKSVFIDESIGVPEEYIRTKIEREPDKRLIKEALESGIELDGAEIVIENNINFRGM